MKLVANSNAVLGHAIGSLIQGGIFVITSAPSAKVTAGGGGVFAGQIQYTFSGGSAAGYDPGSVATTAPQVISASATKVSVDSKSVVLEGDFGVMAAQGTISGVASAVSGPVEVASAGQTKVSAV